MGAFCGESEPLVGEIVGLRTFRVDDAGMLLPLYSGGAWYDGRNTAVCSPPTGEQRHGVHPVPSDDCECGFYAYGTRAAAGRHRQLRYVQAVVACWGGVVAGTQGIRAEHARIEALWLSPQVPRSLRSRVMQRYPSARFYADVDAMLGEHPLSPLGCYADPESERRSTRVAAALAIMLMLALGALPLNTLHTSTVLWTGWLAVIAAATALTGWLTFGSDDVGHLAAAFVVAGVVAWLVAPLFGVLGWVLRLPLLRGVAVAIGGYLIALWPRYFPVVRTPRERAFCGVRP